MELRLDPKDIRDNWHNHDLGMFANPFGESFTAPFESLTEAAQTAARTVLQDGGSVVLIYWRSSWGDEPSRYVHIPVYAPEQVAQKEKAELATKRKRICKKCGGKIDTTRWLGPATSKYAKGPAGPFALFACEECHALHHEDGSLSDKDLSALEASGLIE